MRAWAASIVLAGLLLAGSAEAHRFRHPKVLRLGIRGDKAFLTTTLDVNPGPEALRTRGLFDRDADGRLSADEQDKLESALQNMAWLFLKTRIGGRPAAWALRERVGHRLDKPATDDTTLGIALLHEAPLSGDELVFEFEDRDKDKRDHVPLDVDVAEGWTVVLATQGEWYPEARQLRGIRLDPERTFRLVLRRTPTASP